MSGKIWIIMIQCKPPRLFSKLSVCFFPGAPFWLPNWYRFSRSTSIATEQITIFQEAFFEYQRTDRQFPGRYPPPNRYFSNRSWWLLSNFLVRKGSFIVIVSTTKGNWNSFGCYKNSVNLALHLMNKSIFLRWFLIIRLK